MQKLENLAEQTIFFFILRLLRTDPLKVLNRDEIEIISHNVQKVCGIANPDAHLNKIDLQFPSVYGKRRTPPQAPALKSRLFETVSMDFLN